MQEKWTSSLLFIGIFLIVNIPIINALLIPYYSRIGIVILLSIIFLLYTHKKEKRTKTLFFLIGCCVFVNFFFVIGWLESPWPTPPLHGKDICMRAVREGTLYSNQPYCYQGPFVYYIGKIINDIPGDSDANFQLVSMTFLFISFLLVTEVTKILAEKQYFFFTGLLFVFYFIKVGEDDFTTILATFFLLTGLYLLFVSQKELGGGVFLAIATFSKAQFILVSICVIGFYIVSKTKKEYLKLGKVFLKLVFPSLLILVLILWQYPHFWDYYYTANMKQAGHLTATEVAISLVTFKYAYNGLIFLFYLIFFISLIRIINRKGIDLPSFMCSILFGFLMFMMLKSFGIEEFSETYRYFFPIFIFLPANIFLFAKEFQSFHKYLKVLTITGVLLLGIFLYQAGGGVTGKDLKDGSIFNEEKILRKLQQEMSYPLFFVPEPSSGKILISENYSALFKQKDASSPFLFLSDENFENVELKDSYASTRPDMNSAPYLVELGIVESLEPYNPLLNQSIPPEVSKEYYQGTYPVIIMTLTRDNLYTLITSNRTFFEENYCGFSIGNLPIGYSPSLPHRIFLFFHDKELCFFMNSKTYEYYKENYQNICRRGQASADIMDEVFEKNNFAPESCTSFFHTTDYMVKAHFQALYLCIILFVTVLIAILRNYTHKIIW